MKECLAVGHAYEQRSGDGSENHDAGKDGQHGGEDNGECAIGTFLVASLAEAVEHSDHGDGRGAADQEVREQVGKLESGAVGVLLEPGAKDVIDDLDADETQQAGGDGAEHQQDGGGTGGVLAGESAGGGAVRWWGRYGVGRQTHQDSSILECGVEDTSRFLRCATE